MFNSLLSISKNLATLLFEPRNIHLFCWKLNHWEFFKMLQTCHSHLTSYFLTSNSFTPIHLEWACLIGPPSYCLLSLTRLVITVLRKHCQLPQSNTHNIEDPAFSFLNVTVPIPPPASHTHSLSETPHTWIYHSPKAPLTSPPTTEHPPQQLTIKSPASTKTQSLLLKGHSNPQNSYFPAFFWFFINHYLSLLAARIWPMLMAPIYIQPSQH